MSVRCGIIGTPNAGKSTLFNALTLSNVPAESFPFCTIEPNSGISAVRDTRLLAIAQVVGVETQVPVTLEFVDIAGLVEGASRGEGLGNRFLSHIREMDVIAHVVGCFDSQSDWQSDVDVVNLELILADLATVSKALDKASRRARIGEKSQKIAVNALTRVLSALESDASVSDLELDPEEREFVDQLHLLTTKRKFYVMNIDESQLDRNASLQNVPQSSIPAVSICAELESELAKMPEQEQDAFRIEMGGDHSAIERVVQAAYSVLELRTFFTFNESEVRAWAIPKGTTAKQAAGRIHTDMETGFIRVEVMDCSDLVALGSEQAVKKAGKLRIEGKTYLPQDGEILRVRFNS